MKQECHQAAVTWFRPSFHPPIESSLTEMTYFGSVHPQEALQQYRAATGIDAKLVVVGMVSNDLTIADPTDSNTLNLTGFDTSTPEVLSLFTRGEL